MRILETPAPTALTLTASFADFTGVAITENPPQPMPFFAIFILHAEITTAAVGLNRITGQILLGSTVIGSTPLLQTVDNSLGGGTVVGYASGTLAAGATNTIKAQVKANSAGGVSVAGAQSKLIVFIDNAQVS
jgi:hypothetical protein